MQFPCIIKSFKHFISAILPLNCHTVSSLRKVCYSASEERMFLQHEIGCLLGTIWKIYVLSYKNYFDIEPPRGKLMRLRKTLRLLKNTSTQGHKNQML